MIEEFVTRMVTNLKGHYGESDDRRLGVRRLSGCFFEFDDWRKVRSLSLPK